MGGGDAALGRALAALWRDGAVVLYESTAFLPGNAKSAGTWSRFRLLQ